MTADLAVYTATEHVAIADVRVGERARKDHGDLTDLMASISLVGLLQPIGLAPGNHLLFGGRRLEACRRLGWESIAVTRPATQTDALSLMIAERDENTCRKDMTPEELVDLGLRIEELERPKADKRIADAATRGRETRWGDGLVSHEPSPSAWDRDGATNTVVGGALGLSGSTYFRAKKVVQTARGDTPATPEVQAAAQEALADLNAGKASINGAYDKVRDARRPKKTNTDDTRLAIPQPPRMGSNRRKHLQILQATTTALAGLAVAADEITELDNSVTPEDAAQLLRDFQHIRSLNRIQKLLKERAR